MADADPRLDPPPLAEVPALVAAGAARYNAGDFWHAHEAWEQAWHSLRKHGLRERADLVQALVWVTAAFENLRRGKPRGAQRQLAKALPRLRALHAHAAALGLADAAGFADGVARALDQARSGRAEPPRLRVP